MNEACQMRLSVAEAGVISVTSSRDVIVINAPISEVCPTLMTMTSVKQKIIVFGLLKHYRLLLSVYVRVSAQLIELAMYSKPCYFCLIAIWLD